MSEVSFVRVALLVALYLLPTIVAVARAHRSTGGIVVINLLLGWTAIGWIVALAWSFSWPGDRPER